MSAAQSPSRRFKVLTGVALAVLFIAGAVIGILDRLSATGDRAPPQFELLSVAADEVAFEKVVIERAAAPPPPASSPALPASAAQAVKSARCDPRSSRDCSILPLRLEMFVDSILLEPAYATLLVMFMAALRAMSARAARRWDWPFQFACLLVATAVTFDLAENSMAVRAAEDGLVHLLAQGTVDDVHLATCLKWSFLGAASFAMGVFALRVPAATAARDGLSVAGLRLGGGLAIATAPFAAMAAMRVSGPIAAYVPGFVFALALTILWWTLRRRGFSTRTASAR